MVTKYEYVYGAYDIRIQEKIYKPNSALVLKPLFPQGDVKSVFLQSSEKGIISTYPFRAETTFDTGSKIKYFATTLKTPSDEHWVPLENNSEVTIPASQVVDVSDDRGNIGEKFDHTDSTGKLKVDRWPSVDFNKVFDPKYAVQLYIGGPSVGKFEPNFFRNNVGYVPMNIELITPDGETITQDTYGQPFAYPKNTVWEVLMEELKNLTEARIVSGREDTETVKAIGFERKIEITGSRIINTKYQGTNLNWKELPQPKVYKKAQIKDETRKEVLDIIPSINSKEGRVILSNDDLLDIGAKELAVRAKYRIQDKSVIFPIQREFLGKISTLKLFTYILELGDGETLVSESIRAFLRDPSVISIDIDDNVTEAVEIPKQDNNIRVENILIKEGDTVKKYKITINVPDRINGELTPNRQDILDNDKIFIQYEVALERKYFLPGGDELPVVDVSAGTGGNVLALNDTLEVSLPLQLYLDSWFLGATWKTPLGGINSTDINVTSSIVADTVKETVSMTRREAVDRGLIPDPNNPFRFPYSEIIQVEVQKTVNVPVSGSLFTVSDVVHSETGTDLTITLIKVPLDMDTDKGFWFSFKTAAVETPPTINILDNVTKNLTPLLSPKFHMINVTDETTDQMDIEIFRGNQSIGRFNKRLKFANGSSVVESSTQDINPLVFDDSYLGAAILIEGNDQPYVIQTRLSDSSVEIDIPYVGGPEDHKIVNIVFKKEDDEFIPENNIVFMDLDFVNNTISLELGSEPNKIHEGDEIYISYNTYNNRIIDEMLIPAGTGTFISPNDYIDWDSTFDTKVVIGEPIPVIEYSLDYKDGIVQFNDPRENNEVIFCTYYWEGAKRFNDQKAPYTKNMTNYVIPEQPVLRSFNNNPRDENYYPVFEYLHVGNELIFAQPIGGSDIPHKIVAKYKALENGIRIKAILSNVDRGQSPVIEDITLKFKAVF